MSRSNEGCICNSKSMLAMCRLMLHVAYNSYKQFVAVLLSFMNKGCTQQLWMPSLICTYPVMDAYGYEW
jgi:hypothetical protein